MKRFLLVIVSTVFCLAYGSVFAQDRSISGTVTSAEDGTGIPGVNIIVKGTATGTVTDSDGKYTLSVPASGGSLIFSFIGYSSQEVPIDGKNTFDIQMQLDAKQLGEVVVTAQGIETSTKSLGYSVQKLNNEQLVQGRTASVLSSLQGKLAGVQVSGGSGAPGSSTKVIIRGFTSLTGGNNPLYVVDGVPVDNSFTGSTGLSSAVDYGSRINDINPEDIESLTVLKGAAATTLYGSRAASGVVIITTKKGKDAALLGKKAEVTFASSLMMEDPLKLPTFQNKFGQGFFGSTRDFLNENTSWGSRFDGEVRQWGRAIDNQQRIKPFVALPDNVKDFFETGKTYTNSVSLQGGNAVSNYYVSYANVNADGIMPTDADSYKRNTLSVRGATTLTNKISSSASLNYARTESSFVPSGQGGSVWNQILQTPRDISLLELEDLDNKFNNLEGYYSEFTINPWNALKNYGSNAVIDRLYGNVEVGYKAADWLNFTARIGSDFATTEQLDYQPKQVITGVNSGRSNPGNFAITNIYNRQFNADFLGNFSKDLSQAINLSGLVGLNINERQTKNLTTQINDLVIPGYYNIGNSANSPTATTFPTSNRRLVGVFAQANLSYKDYLFLSLSGRNDWSSTLPEGNRGFFYPGVNLGFDVTTALGVESSTISYAKLRASWAQAGKDAPPYQIVSTFNQAGITDGFTFLNAPFAQSIPAYEVSGQIGNANLQPEISTEVELGADLRFLNNRLGLDATIYQRDVKDNILPVPVAASSGYGAQVLNIAKLRNKGIELLLTATPVMINSFKWDVSVNWSKNVSEVLDLGGPSQITLGGIGGNSLIARVGGPMFEIEGNLPLRDAQGRIVVNAAGQPLANPNQQVVGSTQYRFVGGLTNRFSYKGISLSSTFDIRNGGVLYSRTANLGYFSGTAPATTYNDRNPFIVPNSGLQVVDANGDAVLDEDGFPVTVENTTAIYNTNGAHQTYWQTGGTRMDKAFLVSKSYVKLRELVLAYSIPKALLERTPFGNIDISLIGRNLFVWVPKENVFIDPEQTTFGNDLASEWGEFGASPTTRSYGFNIRITL